MNNTCGRCNITKKQSLYYGSCYKCNKLRVAEDKPKCRLITSFTEQQKNHITALMLGDGFIGKKLDK